VNAFRYCGVVALKGAAQDVKIAGSFAYVSTDSGLSVVDISDPASPRVTGFVLLAGTGNELTLNRNYAYVAGSGTCVNVVDIASSAAPVLVRSAGNNAYYVWGVDSRAPVSGTDTLIAAATNCGVTLFYERTPGILTLARTISTADPLYCSWNYILPADTAYFPVYKWGFSKVDDVAFRGSDLFMLYFEPISGGSLLRVKRYSIANPVLPVETDTITLLYGGCALGVGDSAIYVAHLGGYRTLAPGELTTAGLDVIDTRGKMTRIGSVTFAGSGEDIAVRNDTLIVACGTGGIAVINCANKTRPVVSTITNTTGTTKTLRAKGVDESKGIVCVADLSMGLVTYYLNDNPVVGSRSCKTAYTPSAGSFRRGSYTLTGRKSPQTNTTGIILIETGKGLKPVLNKIR
jgi:hypothetical protein